MENREAKTMDVNYETMSFEEFDVNPYEIVIALSRDARMINDKAQKYFGAGHRFKPINLALKKLEKEDLQFERIPETEGKTEKENGDSSGV